MLVVVLISGKYSHAACFPLQVAFTDERGQRHHAVSAMVTNFTKPTPQKPSLLKFKEVLSKIFYFSHYRFLRFLFVLKKMCMREGEKFVHF
jgi:hypothetical protein